MDRWTEPPRVCVVGVRKVLFRRWCHFWPVVVFFYCFLLRTNAMSVLGGFSGRRGDRSGHFTKKPHGSPSHQALPFSALCTCCRGRKESSSYVHIIIFITCLTWLMPTIVSRPQMPAASKLLGMLRVVGKSHANTHNTPFLELSMILPSP